MTHHHMVATKQNKYTKSFANCIRKRFFMNHKETTLESNSRRQKNPENVESKQIILKQLIIQRNHKRIFKNLEEKYNRLKFTG